MYMYKCICINVYTYTHIHVNFQHIFVGSSNESLAPATPQSSRSCFSWGDDTQREGARWISFPRTLALDSGTYRAVMAPKKSDQFGKRVIVIVFDMIVIMVIV